MSQLRKFIKDNRELFDDEVPAPDNWDKIRDRMESGKAKKERSLHFLSFARRFSAAATVVLLCAGGWLYFSLQHVTPAKPVAVNNRPAAPEIKQQPAAEQPEDSPVSVKPAITKAASAEPKRFRAENPSPVPDSEEADYAEEMYHYSRLVEIKHQELKALQKDEPLLYKKFSGDVNKLDSVYQALKTQLPKNSNREQLIEAMITNLQLQIGLLNKQLDIIKQIKHSKKSAYEKAYKSV